MKTIPHGLAGSAPSIDLLPFQRESGIGMT